MTVLGEKISVCLLTYNHLDLIESTMLTVLAQAEQGFELIVSDDHSIDGTWEKILELAKSDSRIKPIQTPHNMGMAGNANYAVSQSSRPYIALLHHDDLYRQDLLTKWSGVMDRHAAVGFVFNQYGVFHSDYVYVHPYMGETLDGRQFLEKHLFPFWGCPVRGTALIRRDAFVAVGGMREKFGLLADVDLWMRLSRNFNVGYVAEPIIVVRQNRPEYYPDIYNGNFWSWKRQLYLYEIHAINRDEYFCGIRRLFEMFKFRFRVTMETLKWLVYAIVRNKPEMLQSSEESASKYDLPGLNVFRSIARLLRAGQTIQS